jgi:hypothetical protein
VSKLIIDKAFGREAFGLDPAGYHAARPGYPDWVYDVIHEHCGLRQNTAIFEIGPGTGIATRRLLELGANPLVAVEPDNRLAGFLCETIQSDALTVSIEHRTSSWSLVLDPDQVVNLYATFSNINIRPDREAILAELGRIARDNFQGRVTRNMVTSLYMARRMDDCNAK